MTYEQNVIRDVVNTQNELVTRWWNDDENNKECFLLMTNSHDIRYCFDFECDGCWNEEDDEPLMNMYGGYWKGKPAVESSSSEGKPAVESSSSEGEGPTSGSKWSFGWRGSVLKLNEIAMESVETEIKSRI